jgi:hypothetical protein
VCPTYDSNTDSESGWDLNLDLDLDLDLDTDSTYLNWDLNLALDYLDVNVDWAEAWDIRGIHEEPKESCLGRERRLRARISPSFCSRFPFHFPCLHSRPKVEIQIDILIHIHIEIEIEAH